MAAHHIALQEHSAPCWALVTSVATSAVAALFGGVAAKVTRFVTLAGRAWFAGVSLVA